MGCKLPISTHMSIEVAPKKEERPWWQTMLFYLSFISLVLSLLLYLFLQVYFIPELKKGITAKTDEITKESQNKDGSGEQAKKIEEVINDVKRAKTEVEDFKNFYYDSKKASTFFPLFENMVHPQVYFDSFSLRLDDKKAEAQLSGETEGFESLIQQIEILQLQRSVINSFEVSNIVKSGEGTKVKFNLLLNLSESIFERSSI